MALNETDKQLALFVLQHKMLDAQSVRQLGFLAEQRQSSFYQTLLESQQLTQKQLTELQTQLPISSVGPPGSVSSAAAPGLRKENFKPTAKLQSSQLQEALAQAPGATPPIQSTGHYKPPSTSSGSLNPNSSQERTPMTVGATLGPYKLLSELGKGGMGIVYKAHHTALDKICALKVLIAGQDAPAAVLQRFIAEAKLAAKLEGHPNIVRVLDSGVIDNRYFMSMELIDGSSLSGLLAENKVSQKAGARVVEDMAKALSYAHSFGIIHRDVKPQNILIDRSSKAHLSDFGVAKASDGEEGFTTTGALVGTLSYMSPEQAEDAKHIDETADVYSLGAILYHILTGRAPHTGVTHTNILMSLATKTPPKPSSINPDADPLLEAICLKALAKNPQNRYQSAEALAEAIQKFRHGDREDLSTLLVLERDETAAYGKIIVALISLALIAVALLFAFSNDEGSGNTRAVKESPEPPKSYEVMEWSPAPRSLVNTPLVTIHGRVAPEIQKVRAAGQSAAVVDGAFSIELALSEGLNRIPFEFFLGSEEKPVFETSYLISTDFTKPKLQLNDRVRSSKLGDLTVHGTCIDSSEVQIRCQDFQQTLRGTTFKFTVKIRSGPNHFALHARDKAGNETMVPFTTLGESNDLREKPPLVPKAQPKPKPEPKLEPKPEPKPKAKREKKQLVELITKLNKDEPLEEPITLVFKLDPKVERIKWDNVNYDTDNKERWEIYVRPSKFDRRIKAKIFIDGKRVDEFRVPIKASKKLNMRPPVSERFPLLDTVQLSARGYRFKLKVRIPEEPDGSGYPKVTIPHLGKSPKLDRNGGFSLSLKHDKIITGLVATLTHKDGRVEHRDLIRPLPLLHDINLWKKFGSNLGLKLLSREIDLASKILGPDFERLSISVYECHQLSFRIARYRHKPTGIDLHLIPGGTFQMGSSVRGREQPIHDVALKPFLIGRQPVEGVEFYTTYAPNKLNKEQAKESGRPIDEISFEIVRRFLKYTDDRLRLPSEAEWEYAARGGSTTKFFWGDEFDPSYCWYRENSGGKRRKLLEHKNKHNAFGLIDALGHVAEWVMDSWTDDYSKAPKDGTAFGKIKDKYGVVRGGAIGGDGRASIKDCRSASRHKLKRKDKKGKYNDVGFRVACDLKIPRTLP